MNKSKSRTCPLSAAFLILLFAAGCGQGESALDPIPFTPNPLPAPGAPPHLAGTWHLSFAGMPLQIEFNDAAAPQSITGFVLSANGVRKPLSSIRWDPDQGRIDFHATADWGGIWVHGAIVEGVLTGRFAPSPEGDLPLSTAFSRHVTGWQANYFDGSLSPRVYEVLIGDNIRARIRLDRDPDRAGAFVGRFKVHSTVANGVFDEGPERDVEVTAWDGNHLHFIEHRLDESTDYVHDAVVSGREIRGIITGPGDNAPAPFKGVRAEVLSHGFSPLSPADRSRWQARARRQFAHLVMADNPAPLSRTVMTLSHRGPLPAPAYPMLRDDDPDFHSPHYQLTELRFDYTLPNPYGNEPLQRTSHGWLAIPDGPAPPGGFPGVVALNGHDGSAHAVMDPSDIDHWYGDGFARRGFVVLSIDISHRPLADRGGLYDDYLEADDAAGGNALHPSIRAPGFDSDWAEPGERSWDALRGFEYLLSMNIVNPEKAIMAGMSMGGDVTIYSTALDRRVRLAITANYAPDLSVLHYKNAHPCWHWLSADIREYLEPSDLHALIAPRPLVVETGRVDYTFSLFHAPYAGDKQVVRRSRAAFTDAPDHLVHYLHEEEHHYHFGDFDPGLGKKTGVRIVKQAAPDPGSPWSIDWQLDASVNETGMTVFDYIERVLQ